MCKKILALFLCVLLAVGVMTPLSHAESQDISVSAENGSTVKVSAVNRPIQAADELILFTRDNAAQLTDSNVWCAAAAADYKDGKYVLTEIRDRAGAVKIPYNGFVLFGHGTSETWILDNLKTGEEVNINGYSLPRVITGQLVSAENGTQHAIDSVDKEHESNKLTIYTINYGENTGVFGTDTEEAVIANNIVAEKNSCGGTGTYIPENGYVISGSGSAKEFVGNLQVGEKVTLINLEVQTLPPMYFKINGSIYEINKKNTERGAGEVILYETSYGATTRTNPWGLEITAENGKVTGFTAITSKDGVYLDNNSSIPQKGYVISVQADSPYFAKLDGNVKVGDSIELSANNTFLYNAGKTPYDSLNPKSREDNPAGWDEAGNSGYPGFRGADQLIVYDGAYGSTTGTNPWGYEVTVDKDNKIVKAGGNNSQIPKDGLVLSGHGVKADWLKNHALIGSSVIMDKTDKTVLVLFTPESMIDRAVIKIDTVKQELEVSRTKFLDVPYAKVQEYIDNAELLVESARERLKERDYKQLMEITGRIEQNSDNAHFANYQSKSVETRAVWIRPKETRLEQVSEHLDKLKALNINTVYLETWWGGYTIFPTENRITEQNPMYNGFDVLGAYLSEAHKRGMEVHSWVENFFIGDSGTFDGGPVYAKKPEWLLISRKGDNFQFVDMYNIKYYFANPALPETRDFIMSIYSELVKKYDIDGLQLDYVRYPDGGDGSNDFGYDTYTRELFKKANGADPINIRPGDPLWESWCAFRANIINTFVYRVVSEVRAVKPDIQISADVWPNYEAGPATLMQEPAKWVSGGYIDNVIPMSYTMDTTSTREDILNTVEFSRGHAYATMGLGTGTGLSSEMLAGQIATAAENGADGTALFEYESLMNAGYGSALKEGLFRNTAVVWDDKPALSVKTIVNGVKRKISEIYLPNKGISAKEAASLADRLNSIPAADNNCSETGINPSEARAIKKSIEKIIEMVTLSKSMNEEVKKRILEDMTYCSSILVNYINHEEFHEKHAIDHFTLELPPEEEMKVGKSAEIKVRAAFKDGKDIIMYLDPSQFKVSSSNPEIAQVNGSSIVLKAQGCVDVTVSISKNFIYKYDKKEQNIKTRLKIK